MTLSNQVEHGLTGFEENFNLPAFSINPNDFFFAKRCISADESKPILTISLISNTYDFGRDWIFFSYDDINRKKIFGSATTLFVLRIDFLDVKLLVIVGILDPTAFS